MPDPGAISDLLSRWESLHRQGQSLTPEELCRDCPELLPEVRREVERLRAFPSAADPGLTVKQSAESAGCELPSVPGYEVLAELGRGGMGVVYKARHVGLNRLVALKMILAGDHAGASARARFRVEGEAVARLQHPNIVQIYEIGEDAGRPYFALEFVEGGSLSQKSGGLPQPSRDAAHLVEILARAIQAAHQRGLIHRDLKPGNVLLTREGVPKIADFGLVKLLEQEPGAAPEWRTHSGAVLGTPSYMAPEQARGQSREIGPATDVYALGAILYELLTGRPPFQGDSLLTTLEQVATTEPVPPRRFQPKIPRDLETVCLKCLRKEPARRYAGARELADDLARFLAREPVRARPVGPVGRLGRWGRRNPVVATFAAVTATALLAVAVVSVAFAVHSGRAAQDLASALGEAREGRRAAEERLAENSRDRGVTLCEAGEADRGILWLARALQQTPAGADALEKSVRTRLTAWSHDLLPLRACLPHAAKVAAVAFDPSGRTFLTASGRTVSFWNAASTRPEGELLEAFPIDALALSRDGRTLATASIADGRGLVRLWDVATRQPAGKPLVHPLPVNGLAFSPDGRTLLTGGGGLDVFASQGEARLWRVADGTLVRALPHAQTVWSVAFSPDGRTLLTGSGDLAGLGGAAQLWGAEAGDLRGSLPHPRAVLAVAFDPDGRRIATGCWDRKARLWDAGARELLGMPLPHQGAVRAVAFSPDGKALLTAGDDQSARLWSVRTGAPLAPPLHHRDAVHALAFHPDGRMVLTGGLDRTARLWSVAAPPAVRHQGAVDCVAFSPDGRTFATGGRDRAARLWSARTGEPLGRPLRHDKLVHAVAFSPDGTRLLTASADGTARLWEPAGGEPRGEVLRHDGFVAAIAFSRDGKTVVTASHDGTARLWDAATGQPRGEPLRHQGSVKALALSPDGTTLATAGDDGAARLWDVATGQARGEPLRHGGQLEAVAFSPGGDLLVTAGADRTARRWVVATGEPLGPLLGHEARVVSVAFSPDGKTIATGSWDWTARLWDAETGRPRGAVMQHQNVAWVVAFHPDGEIVLTASGDETARLWDARTGQPYGAAFRHQGPVRAAAFSPDGRTVLTASGDETARLWPTPEAREGDPARIATWVEVSTGLTLDPGGRVEVLDAAAWAQRRRALENLPARPPP